MPVERTLERMRRILVLVPWVLAHPDPTVEEVCARFSLTPEELSADIELLMMCGLPPFLPGDYILADIEGGRVSIGMAEHLERPARLTRTEAVALLVMGRAIMGLPDAPEAPSLASALDKLAGAVSADEAAVATEMAQRIAVELAAPGTDLLSEVRRAIDERQTLAIQYFSEGRGEMTERTIEPLVAFNAMGNWYVAATDHASGEERTFRIDRIKSVTPTGGSFEPPAGFDPGRYADGPVVVASRRDHRVVLDVEPEAAWVAEFVPTEHEQERARGRRRITVRTAHFAWLIRLLLSAGESITIVEPDELLEARAEAARAALERYGAEGGSAD